MCICKRIVRQWPKPYRTYRHPQEEAIFLGFEQRLGFGSGPFVIVFGGKLSVDVLQKCEQFNCAATRASASVVSAVVYVFVCVQVHIHNHLHFFDEEHSVRKAHRHTATPSGIRAHIRRAQGSLACLHACQKDRLSCVQRMNSTPQCFAAFFLLRVAENSLPASRACIYLGLQVLPAVEIPRISKIRDLNKPFRSTATVCVFVYICACMCMYVYLCACPCAKH
jgi:hypothetical protein